jgi:hypothetical protein
LEGAREAAVFLAGECAPVEEVGECVGHGEGAIGEFLGEDLREEFGLVADELYVSESEGDLVDLPEESGDGFAEVVGEGEIGEVKLGGVGVALILLLEQLCLQPVQLPLLPLALHHSEPQ